MKLQNAKLALSQLVMIAAAFCLPNLVAGGARPVLIQDELPVELAQELEPAELKSGQLRGSAEAGGENHRSLARCDRSKKIVSIYKFCIHGDCDAGANGEHRFSLNGYRLHNDFREYPENSCRPVYVGRWRVDAWKSLSVGTQEHDDWSEDDYWFATMVPNEWSIDTTETYEIKLAKSFKSERQKSLCINASASVKYGPGRANVGAQYCERWTDPAESFVWYLKVEPYCW